MKSLIALWNILANEMAGRCGTSTTMDQKTVQGRTEHEGLSFLTITLPSFGKDFQKSLNQGLVAPDLFLPFQSAGQTRLPSFLRGFSELVFDSGTGVLVDSPSIDAIQAIRQLTLMFAKMLLPCSIEREEAAMVGFINCEKEVRERDSLLMDSDYIEFHRMSSLLFRSIFSRLDGEIYRGEIRPKHGPGATADKLMGNQKFMQLQWTDRLEKVFHSGDFLFPSARFFVEHYDELSFLEPGSEQPVKVISVPKTQKTPRIIAIEPTAMQYVQQGVLEALNHGISRSFLADLISSESQLPNQQLALQGSIDGSLATLDLSDASDRVSNQLIRTMLRDFPHLQQGVEACRSRRADVPGHGVIRLSKFASMGSALCFPFEAMVFLTLTFLGIEESTGHRFTRTQEFNEYAGQVRIYGDDIIVPVDHVHTVVNSLEHFGARVGTDKSFWIGRFRESCGKEYYSGHDVSIVKVRRMFPAQRQNAPEVMSLVSLRNQFYMNGNWSTAAWLDRRIGEVLSYFPNVMSTSQGLGRITSLGYDIEKMDEQLHAPMVKAYVPVATPPENPLDGYGALLKFFLKRGSLPSADGRHLERSGRPRAVHIKPGWVSPF